MKRLLVMRHAKSDWGTGLPDHERPLNSRGIRSAKQVGIFLTRAGQAPKIILSSSAVRARTTAELASTAGEWDSVLEIREELYGADVAGTLSVTATVPDDATSAMLVGHQPTWSSLVRHLTGASVQMKTAAVAAIDVFADRWDEIPEATGEIAFVIQPRLFDGWESGPTPDR